MIKHYPSPSALAADYRKNPLSASAITRGGFDAGRDWFSGEDEADTLRLAATGDTRLVATARGFIDHLSANIETPRRAIAHSVAGGWPSVPDAIMGRPLSMRRVVKRQVSFAPITICVDTSCSAGIKARDMQMRGAAILALVMALVPIRPVTLYQMAAMYGDDASGETVLCTRINTTPLDLATACYILTSTGYSRRLCYRLSAALGNPSASGWPRGFPRALSYNNPNAYLDALRGRMGLKAENSLMIPAVILGDPIIGKPLEWIQKQIEHFTQPTASAGAPAA